MHGTVSEHHGQSRPGGIRISLGKKGAEDTRIYNGIHRWKLYWKSG
jgi:hypothetical protein